MTTTPERPSIQAILADLQETELGRRMIVGLVEQTHSINTWVAQQKAELASKLAVVTQERDDLLVANRGLRRQVAEHRLTIQGAQSIIRNRETRGGKS